MNKAIIMGRLTRDPAITYKANNDEQLCIARFTLAVNRPGKANRGDNTADFIDCVAFGGTGKLVEQYCKQGTKLAVEGKINTSIYEYEPGKKIKSTNIKVDNIEFAESKKTDSSVEPIVEPDKQQETLDTFTNVVGDDSNLPFNY